ncbi:hypothetical protein BGZ65_011371, partial [Modicella reniformis]
VKPHLEPLEDALYLWYKQELENGCSVNDARLQGQATTMWTIMKGHYGIQPKPIGFSNGWVGVVEESSYM